MRRVYVIIDLHSKMIQTIYEVLSSVIEKMRTLPHPGLRNIKTALAAVLCIVLYQLILTDRDGVALACIAVFICMQDSVDKTWSFGRDRAIGTLLGGALGWGASALHLLDRPIYVIAGFMFLAIVTFIFLCNLIRLKGAIVIGLATFSIIVFVPQHLADYLEPLPLAIARTLDTLVGVAVGVLTNVLLFRPRPERFRGSAAKNPVFHYEHREASHHRTMKWDGGFSQELFIYPEDALYQDLGFQFRLAVTTGLVERSVFRKFPGYKRRIMLLGGEMQLKHRDRHDIVLGQYEQDCFMGDWETQCFGKGVDISLLMAEGFCGQIKLLYCGDKPEEENDRFVSFYGLEDGVKLYFESEGRTYKAELNRGDSVVVSWYENGRESYTVEAKHEDKHAEQPLAVMVSCARTARKEEEED